jgi:hypothetical protein
VTKPNLFSKVAQASDKASSYPQTLLSWQFTASSTWDLAGGIIELGENQ